MSSTGVAALRFDTYEGSRAPLRHLFELAEDSAVQFEAYLGRGEVLAAQDAFTPATGYPDPITIDGIILRDRVWFGRDLAVVLPGEGTLLASWRALARLSVGAQVTSYPLARAAILPLWEPLNNAIVTSVAGRDTAAAHLAAVYRAAGVGAGHASVAAEIATPAQPGRADVDRVREPRGAGWCRRISTRRRWCPG